MDTISGEQPAEHLNKVVPFESVTGNVAFLESQNIKKRSSFLLLRCKAADRLDQNGANNIAARHHQPADKSKGLQGDVLEPACGRESSDQLEIVFFLSWRAFGTKVSL